MKKAKYVVDSLNAHVIFLCSIVGDGLAFLLGLIL